MFSVPKWDVGVLNSNSRKADAPEIPNPKRKKIKMEESENKKDPKPIVQKKSVKTIEERVHQNISQQSPTTSVFSKMENQLKGGRFRWLNEQLYKTDGETALNLFQNDPKLFEMYHEGFSQQVKQWPIHPLDIIIKSLKEIRKPIIVADMGCGEGRLGLECKDLFEVYSFDLVSTKPWIKACDISKVPLKSGTVDIVVFCLSLMGTNLDDYLKEAFRILKLGGQIWIAEVTSRFVNFSIKQFTEELSTRGFSLQKDGFKNSHFVLCKFVKRSNAYKPNHKIILKPCIYKKR